MDHAMNQSQSMTTAEKFAGIVIAAILLAVFAAHFLH
jgi:hypothetical protein